MHQYPPRTRLIPLMVLAVWLLGGTALYLSIVMRLDEVPTLDRQAWFWAPWLVLLALGIWGLFSYNRRLRPIAVTDEGLVIGASHERGARMIAWPQIQRAVRVGTSATKPGMVPGRAGLYLWTDERPLQIYEQISGFAVLEERIRQELSRRGIPFEGARI